ncbi:hypothetical protein Gorai_011499, partial [Gossypium raimondii]|nr:hypothetical protein [Gossypium raimondii]
KRDLCKIGLRGCNYLLHLLACELFLVSICFDYNLYLQTFSVVIIEGDPHPGATVGRMSFRSFNPSIDKLNEEASNVSRLDASGGRTLSSENGSASEATHSKVGTDKHEGNGDLKRKQSDIQSTPSSGKASSKKQSKREKLDWNVLRPPKPNR